MERSEDQPRTDLSDVAEEAPETSTETEQQVVGENEADAEAGGTVPPDQAQSAHAQPEETGVEDAQPLLGGMMSSDRPESSARD